MDQASTPEIGVALSGGGHRAALFGLGVLLYLADAGKNRNVGSVASVSGGSLANGYVAQTVDYRSVDAASLWSAMAPFARQLAKGGTVLPPDLLTLAYLISLVVVVIAGLVGVWFLPVPIPLRLAAFVFGLAAIGWVASWRGIVASHAFATKLYSRGGKVTPLAGITATLDHVFCAADLHAGENVYFSGRFVCSYRFGWGEPGDLPLHTAVQCSAALPGAFPPRWLRTDRHRFDDGQKEAASATRMALVDGGVYDNMADQWGLGIAARKARWHAAEELLHDVDELIIVNASAGEEWQPVWRMRVPLLGEVLALLRDKSILYDNGNTVRREWAVDRFRSGELRGALVHIPQSPLLTADAYAKGSDEASGRARGVIALLGQERDEWRATAKKSARVSTTLSPIGIAAAASLLRHAYVLAMANLHVILAYPLLGVPSIEAFEEFLR